MKTKANINVYLLLFKDDELLLAKREDTGYKDGQWGLVSGHVEDNESATHAMVREAADAIGIHIFPEDLQVVHVMHRQTERNNIDIFYSCTQWKHEIENKEAHKCSALEFFGLHDMPENTIDYIRKALHWSTNGQTYSELGFQ